MAVAGAPEGVGEAVEEEEEVVVVALPEEQQYTFSPRMQGLP